MTEELVLKNAFDIVFALDECVTFGYRESVTVSQVKTSAWLILALHFSAFLSEVY